MKKTLWTIFAAALLAGPVVVYADTLVDTGVPSGTLINGAPFRAGQVTFTANVQITSVEHFATVATAGDVTFVLHRDDAGLPGVELFSVVTSVSTTAGPDWVSVSGLHWAVPAGTYWLGIETREGQTAVVRRPFGSTVDGTLPPNPLAAEAFLFPPDTLWSAAGGRSGWRVLGQDGPGIYGIGDLPGSAFYSEVRDATKVGGVIMAVGNSSEIPDSGVQDTGVLWTSTKGLVALPAVETSDVNFDFASGRAITRDGTVIAGSAHNTTADFGHIAVLVTNNGTTNTVLGDLRGANTGSVANAVSDDGSVAYGFSRSATPGKNEAFRWTAASGIVGLGFLNPDDALSIPASRGVSSDGSVVVGTSSISGPVTWFALGNRAFRYVEGSGMTALPLLAGGTGNDALGVTPDGNVTLGSGDSPAFPNGELIRWNAIAGTTEALGSPDSTLSPNAVGSVTGDGQVVVLKFVSADFAVSVSYLRNSHGWFLLTDALADAGVDLTDWTLDFAWGVSPDGTLVYGSGQHKGNIEGWVTELPVNYLRDYGPGDSTPPIITPVVTGTLGDNGWYRSNVTVAWQVTDAESAISSSQGCTASSVTRDKLGTTFTCSATSDGGTSAASVTIKRDTLSPVALILSPLIGTTYKRNGRVTALYVCVDIPSGIAQCAGTVPVGSRVDTATAGTKSFTVNARDKAGNTRAVTVQYRVR
jgi:probable HAF family extracellular repeat protein